MKGLHRKRKATKVQEKGFSLVELMIAMAVMLIGFAASYNLFQLGYKYLNLGTDITQARQEIRMSVEKMVKELQETSGSTVWVDDEAISFASARDADGNFSTITEPPEDRGKPNWQKAVVYFRDAESNTLFKYEEAKVDWSSNFAPSLAFDALSSYKITIVDWSTNEDAHRRVAEFDPSLAFVAEPVTSFVFQLSSNLLSVTIQGKGASEELTTTIRVQN